ncbi:MAG: EF-P lysine aminoacylase GenX [Desulfobulbaceae bacterium]|nr:EF-P lysine aminoacylase GenX [Desulfobulbaceae bacterium]
MLTPQGLQQRSDLLQAIRSFFFEGGYMEVDTPLRLPVLLPESNIVPFASEDWYLHTSPELCMKRLLARGCSQIFQICHCFRKEESGRIHQPEFTMLEWYHKGWGYFDLMRECEALLALLCRLLPQMPGLSSEGTLSWRECRISLCQPWDRLTVAAAFRQHAGVEVDEVLKLGIFDEVLVTAVEPKLGRERPVFLYDYPVALGSLARCRPNNRQVAERFELYIGGVELANGFSELVDPEEQRHRFSLEIERLRGEGKDAAMPETFLADLALVGETAGIALGFDRLFMLLMGYSSLAEAMPFIIEEL